jgi:hypothetical protein
VGFCQPVKRINLVLVVTKGFKLRLFDMTRQQNEDIKFGIWYIRSLYWQSFK